MILFLDFDGVLHPEIHGAEEFCHLARFESVMRTFPTLEIVISSMWRYEHSLDGLKAFFSADIQPRIIGATALYEYVEATLSLARREQEILDWLALNNKVSDEWVALDDREGEFQEHRHRLIACDPAIGFDAEIEAELRAILLGMTKLNVQ